MLYEDLCRRFFGPIMAVLGAAAILVHSLGLGSADGVTIAAGLALVAFGMPLDGKADRIMLCAGAVLSLVALYTEDNPWPIFAKAASSGAFMGAFFAALGALRFVAQVSPAILRCGAMLVSRPPGQRYAALTFGAMIFSTVLNFGSLPLLGTLARDANNSLTDVTPAERETRERRMMLAMLRGFAGCLMTSPTSFSFAVVVSSVPGLSLGQLLPLSILMMLLFLMLGWAYDQLAFRSALSPAPSSNSDGLATVLAPVAVLAILLIGAMAAETVLKISVTEAVLLVLPFVTLGWMLIQARGSLPARASKAGERIADMIRGDFFKMRREIMFVTLLGFLSNILAGLIGAHAPGGGFLSVGPNPGIFIAMLLVIIISGAQVGINPLATVSVMAGLLPPAADVGMSPVVLALTLLTGWSLAIGSSPAGGAINVIALLTGRTPIAVAYRWNGAFTLVAMAALFLYLTGLNLLMT
jgi:hypothetical protein